MQDWDAGNWQDEYDRLAAQDAASGLDTEELEALATAAYMTGREDDYLSVMTRLFETQDVAQKVQAAARTAFWIGLTLMFRGEHGRGGGWVARAVALAKQLAPDSAVHGYVLVPSAEDALDRGDPAEAQALAQRMLVIGEGSGDADLVAIARHIVGRARLAQGDIAAGLADLDRTMIAVTEGRCSPIVTGLIYCSVIDACQSFQIYQRAWEWTTALSGWCSTQPGLVAFTGRCLIHRAEIMVLAGDWSAAEGEAGTACKRLAQGPAAHHAGPAFYQRGEVLRLSGRYGEAVEAYRAASRHGFDPQPGLALIRLAQGKQHSASAAIRRALVAAEKPTERMRLLPAAAEIALAAGDMTAAAGHCAELVKLGETYGSDAVAAVCAEIRATIALNRGEAEAALRDCSRAAAVWRQLPAPHRLASIRLLTGRACAALGDADTARAEAEASLETFRGLGAEPDVRAAKAVLRTLSPSAENPLTPRQTEVLGLVARGLTNREIAGELGLSERTVDRHVSDILTRIDAPTRAAATAWAAANGLIARTSSG
ncbi:helix-turn-helix transcriptional regulator [Tropicimonas sp. IMCC6043]|uniref:helix-turn-helix domain-containing protein n=1 Tax=Tropicimonas sp. IMCC6043 TaxID=2510645 RepID=UPI00101C3FEB|nr:helix-turn-helix transcriptional regulator [Tropicimonas sp. IMCC6043]RYH06737.1 LuxR family transcriptional regulator [Tropicimonas sp. IMCC6043]